MTLKDLRIGESAKITAVGGEGALRQHFLDMGVVPAATPQTWRSWAMIRGFI